jgi:HEAT repeat protein
MSETTNLTQVESLIINLASHDRRIRRQAREYLVAMGKAVIPVLLTTLIDPSGQVRRQAARVLGEIGDPAAASGLVKALEDEALEVRWRAAEALAMLGRDGLTPLLQALMQHSNSVYLRQGAHHVLRALAITSNLKDLVTPVLAALEDVEPVMAVPIAASAALKALKNSIG